MGPDLDERPLHLSMSPNRAIFTEKTIRLSSLAAAQPWIILSRPEALNASGSRPACRMAISRNADSRHGSKAGYTSGWLGSTPEGRRPQIRGFRAGGSLAVATSTPATQLLSPAKMLKLNHARFPHYSV